MSEKLVPWMSGWYIINHVIFSDCVWSLFESINHLTVKEHCRIYTCQYDCNLSRAAMRLWIISSISSDLTLLPWRKILHEIMRRKMGRFKNLSSALLTIITITRDCNNAQSVAMINNSMVLEILNISFGQYHEQNARRTKKFWLPWLLSLFLPALRALLQDCVALSEKSPELPLSERRGSYCRGVIKRLNKTII